MKNVRIPISFNGRVNYKEVSFFRSYSKTEDYDVYEKEINSKEISTKYFLDYFSSVWISNEDKYKEFANTYKVISGGWYPKKQNEDAKGIWRTLKRTFGEMKFLDIQNLKINKFRNDSKESFTIRKLLLSNSIKIKISNKEVGIVSFSCKNITFKFSENIFLYDLKKDNFIDCTEKLKENGLVLK